MLDKLNNILSSHLLCIKYAPCAPDCDTPTPMPQQHTQHTHTLPPRDKMAEAVVATSDNCNACKARKSGNGNVHSTCYLHKCAQERGKLSSPPLPPLSIVSAGELLLRRALIYGYLQVIRGFSKL